MKAKLYIEGGAEGKPADSVFRQGWRKFLEGADIPGENFVIRRCGGRGDAWRDFKNAVAEAGTSGEVPILVVDSEAAVTQSCWQHLDKQDGWKRPEGAGEDQVFLMVQTMETWFLADREGLRRFFGPSFSDSPLKNWPSLEAVDKKTILDALAKATAGKYEKGLPSFQLLETLDSEKVKAACPQARRLFERLSSL